MVQVASEETNKMGMPRETCCVGGVTFNVPDDVRTSQGLRK